jgi:hypothetical protein
LFAEIWCTNVEGAYLLAFGKEFIVSFGVRTLVEIHILFEILTIIICFLTDSRKQLDPLLRHLSHAD